MKHDWDPERLDIRAFARAQAQWAGERPLLELPRLAEEVGIAGTSANDTVRWALRGEVRTVAGGAEQVWLHLSAEATLWLVCQRCLGPVACAVTVARDFRFVADEATATAQDEEAEEDVLVWSRSFDAFALLEDELLMALPLVPMHEACPEEHVLTSDGATTAPEKRPHPFAVLASLRQGKA